MLGGRSRIDGLLSQASLSPLLPDLHSESPGRPARPGVRFRLPTCCSLSPAAPTGVLRHPGKCHRHRLGAYEPAVGLGTSGYPKQRECDCLDVAMTAPRLASCSRYAARVIRACCSVTGATTILATPRSSSN